MKGDRLLPKQLKFVDGLMAGMTQIEAYHQAGYKGNDGNAANLAGTERILQEIARRRTEIEKQNAEIEKQSRLNLISKQQIMLDNLEELALHAESEFVRNAATNSWLDRSGLKPVEKVEQTGSQSIQIITNIPRPDDNESDN